MPRKKSYCFSITPLNEEEEKVLKHISQYGNRSRKVMGILMGYYALEVLGDDVSNIRKAHGIKAKLDCDLALANFSPFMNTGIFQIPSSTISQGDGIVGSNVAQTLSSTSLEDGRIVANSDFAARVEQLRHQLEPTNSIESPHERLKAIDAIEIDDEGLTDDEYDELYEVYDDFRRDVVRQIREIDLKGLI